LSQYAGIGSRNLVAWASFADTVQNLVNLANAVRLMGLVALSAINFKLLILSNFYIF
jgi:hypothetical protein